MKELKGGAPRQRFFSQSWALVVERGELKASDVNVKTLEKENSDLKKKVLSLSNKLREVNNPGARKQYKTVEDLGDRQKRRLKRSRSSSCKASLGWMEQEGYTPIAVQVLNRATHEIEHITMENVQDLVGSSFEVEPDDIDRLDMILLVKDSYSVSDAAYHEMAQLCKSLPRHYKLKDRIKELNKHWNIQTLPHDIEGVQQSLEDRLRIRVEHLVKVSSPDSEFMLSKKLNVKLSGDGTCIGKRLHVVCFTFTLLEESEKTGSFEGNHVLAIFKTPEKYNFVKNALEDIIRDVERLKEIRIGQDTFSIEYYLGGDWKFLAAVTGIDAASSTYACIWCKCKRDERWDTSKEWSISDVTKGARSTEENLEISALPNSRKKFNVSNPPLFPTIPLSHIVIDNLHLFLRVADVLINLLITELRRQDVIDQRKRFNGQFDVSKFKHIAAYEKFVTSLGIPSFSFYIGQTSGQLKCRSLTGPEKLKLFGAIDIKSLLPSLREEHSSKIQHLWSELLELNQLICLPASKLTTAAIEQYEIRAKQWGRDFVGVYHSHNVTPYIHAMMYHVGEFMRIHGSIIPFTQQGLEKHNDIMTKIYFRASSHRGVEALRQIIEKRNRIEYFVDNGSKRVKKHNIVCSNCRSAGHNRLTCQNPCNLCGETYALHLIEIEHSGAKVPFCDVENYM